jgi:hypothetical protein
MKLVNPANKRKFTPQRDRRRHGPGRRVGGGDAGRAGLQREALLLPGQPAPRAQRSPPRAASTPRRTTRTTATASTASSTTRSRAATSAPASPTSTGSRRCRSTSSTSAWPRACPSRASTAACSTTAPSAARRSRARSTRAVRRASSCCSGAYQALMRQVAKGKVKMHTAPRDARPGARRRQARGIVVRDLDRAKLEAPRGRRRVLATGGYGNVFFLSTNAKGCNVTATWRATSAARLREPVLHADPPDLHPGQRRLTSPSSR